MNTETLEIILVKTMLLLAYPIAIIEAHYNYFISLWDKGLSQMKKTEYSYKGEVKRLHRDWVEAWEEIK